MPTTKPTGLPKRGGRKKGVPNRETREIRELIQSTVDWVKLVKAIQTRAIGSDEDAGSDTAARLLFEYGYGRPKEMPEGNGVSEAELISAIKGIARAFMENPGQGVVTQRDNEGEAL